MNKKEEQTIEQLKNIRREIPLLIEKRNNETFFIDGKKMRSFIDMQIKKLQREK